MQRLVPDPVMWDRCYMAWEMRHSGMSYDKIHAATRLFTNINGYDTFFSNPIYMGNVEFGGKVYEGFVPALIPKEWFEQEQNNRAERAKKRAGKKMDRNFEPRRVSSEYLLSGLVVCGHVDGEEHPMNIEHIPAKKGQRGNYTFFVCTTAKNSRNQQCFAKRISIRSIEQAVIDNLMAHVLTVENLRPMAISLAETLQERSRDAGTRIITLESELDEVQKSLNNIMDAFEKMGYATHLQQRYDKRKKEEEELITELSRLKALQVSPKHISAISDQMLEGWLQFMRQALEGEDKSVAKRVMQQFVAKIVIKDGTGTLYYTFPFPDDLYMSSYGNLDLMRV